MASTTIEVGVSSPLTSARSDALRVQYSNLTTDLESLLSRRAHLLRSANNGTPKRSVNASTSTVLSSLESEHGSLRRENAQLRAEISSLQQLTDGERHAVTQLQQGHDQTMQRALEELKEVEVSMQSQRDKNALLQRALTQAQEHLRTTARREDNEDSAQDAHLAEENSESKEKTSSDSVVVNEDKKVSAATTTATTTGGGGGRDYRAETTSEIRSNLDDAWLLRYAALHFEAKLGSGVSSTVYRGTYEGKRVVAIKVIKLERAQKDLKDFKKELYIMSQVHSPHVVEFYGATLEPKLCVVMELCPHGTLFHALTMVPPPRTSMNEGGLVVVEWERALNWCRQIALGMATLHDFDPQIVHRDLKPLNLLLDVAWNVKICDFGLSRYTSADQPSDEMQTLTKLRGTYAYTAPEIYHKAPYTAKSDVYSIGVIFWELGTRLVTGQYARPFAEFAELKYDYQIIYQTATQQLRPTFHADFPPKFRQVIQACWTQEPERRPSATQLLEGIDIAKKDWEKFPKKWSSL